MSISASALFWFSSVLAVVGAIWTVAASRPLRACMGLLTHILSLAALYLTLQAEMLAAIQLLVYAGAVVVLFIFVIMLIGPSAGTVPFEDGTSFGLNRLVLRSLAGTLAAMAFLPILMAVTTYDPAPPSVELCRTTDCVDLGSVDGVGQALFTNAIIPFLVVALTLTVAVVGALAMARGRTPEEITEAKRRRAEREARAARGQGKTSVAEVVA